MTLPVPSYPTFEVELKDRTLTFRPLLVKEEKLLLMAKQEQKPNEIFSAVKRAVSSCCITEGFDVNDLAVFELEYCFLNLRMQSVGDSLDLSLVDPEDNLEYKFHIKLEDIHIFYPESSSSNIMLDDRVGIELRYPPATLYDDEGFLNSFSSETAFYSMLVKSIKYVFNEEEVFEDASEKELLDFVENMSSAAFAKVQKFFQEIPHMRYDIEYTNKKGTERKITLRTLTDFFSF